MKFLSEFSELGRSTQVVSAQSWHAKMYAFWRQHGVIKNENYRENLCHYVRVVLIWAPMAWMNEGRLVRGSIRPIVALLSLLYVISAGLTVSHSQNPGVLAFALGTPPALLMLGFTLQKIYPGKLLLVLKRVGSIIEPPLNWYFSARIFGWVRPFMIVFAVVIGLLVWDNPRYLVSLAAAIVFWSVMIVAAYLAHRHDERKKEKRELERKVVALETELRSMKFGAELEALSQRMINRMITQEEYSRLLDALMKQRYPLDVLVDSPENKSVPERTNPLAEAFRLGIRFAAAKKHKICPFIVFEEEQSGQLAA